MNTESKTEQIKLSDGRTVTMREITAKEMFQAGRLGKGDAMAMSAAAILCAIVDVDGQKTDRPNNIVSVQAQAGGFRARDMGRLRAGFARLNSGETEEDIDPANIVLSDGRRVALRELTGMSELIASNLAKGDPLTTAAALTVLSIGSINGEKFAPPATAADVDTFLAAIKAKDFTLLTAAYNAMNGDSEPGEVAAVG